MCANGLLNRRKKLLILGVCWTISSITHDCHAICAPFSVIGVSLLAPRIAIDVIAAQLPEARLVTRCELQRVHPFGGLPEVKVRNQKTRRPSMIAGKRLARIVEG